MKETFEQVEVGRIVASKWNPRKHFPEEGLRELAESIKQVGVLEPLLVRTKDEGRIKKGEPPEYELVAGERRWRAAKLAESKTVPCLVRELSDDQVLEIQLIENLQREDVSALEEAEGFRRLIDAGKYTAETLAAKLGKSRSHVFGRLRLCKAGPELKRILGEGKLDASKAGLIAQLPEKMQKEIFKQGHPEEWSFRKLKREIEERFVKNLSGAKWKWDDGELLATAGPCTTCPKRSGNMPGYDGSPNVCTDVECFEGKRLAFGARQVAEAKASGKTVIAQKEWEDYRSDVQSRHVELDRTAYDLGKYDETYREVLKKNGKEFEPVLAVTRDGVKEVLPKEKLYELVPRKEERVSRAQSGWEKKARAEQGKKRQLRLALDKAVKEAAPTIAAKARGAKEDLRFWRMVAICAAAHFRDDSKQGTQGYAEEWLIENWKVSKGAYGGLTKGTLQKRIRGLKLEECREAAVVLLGLNVFTRFYDPKPNENFEAACEWAGFDLEGRLKELQQEKAEGRRLKAEKKPEKAKEAKPKDSGRTKKKTRKKK